MAESKDPSALTSYGSPDKDSLERYLLSRGAQILGHTINRSGFTIQAGLGGLMLAAGVAILCSPLFGGGREIIPAAIAPLMAGGINLAVALGMRRQMPPEAAVRVEMSREGKSLLLALYRDVAGWPSKFGIPSRVRSRRMQGRILMAGYDDRMPLPNDQVLALLEAAASSYNRILASIAANRETPSVAKLAPRVTLAADEVMAEVFHQAATLSRYPEGFTAGREKVESQIRSLDEVASRLETLAKSAESEGAQRVSSSVDDVLAELRMEQLARAELAPDEEVRLRVQD